MDFDAQMSQAWTDHAVDARAVATRLPALAELAASEPQLERVIGLAAHVHGAHLGDWPGGRAALQGLRAHTAYRDDDSSGQALRRALAAFALCADASAPPQELSASDQIRVHAMVAEHLVDHDVPRAASMLRQALALAERSGLPDSDAMHRAIAVAANGLACAMEEKPDRSADERALMILAAQSARHHWERAGTWLNVERGEYRLAMTWLQAGDLAQARSHAQRCLEIVAANDGAALEQLFGWEALGLVERAAGNATGHARALAKARAAFDALSPEDQGWCRESVDKLAAGAGAGADPGVDVSPAGA
jgi:hypothetical protein